MPTVLLEQGRDPRKVLEPDRDVDVRVRSRGRAGVEVDRPAAEQPVCDARPLEERVDRGERSELARRRVATVGDEGEGHTVVRDVLVPGGLHEGAAIPVREERVAGDVVVDLREEQLVGERKRLCVDLRAADHEDAVDVAEELDGLLDRAGALRSLRTPEGIPGDDHVAAVRQRAEAVGKRVPRPPPHHHGVSRREFLEVRDVLGDSPRDRSVAADHAVASDGSDESDRHTATGARIAGWCS